MTEKGIPRREVTALNALRDGSAAVKLSAAVWGLGCLVRKQFVKGLALLLADAAYIVDVLVSVFI